MNRDDIIIYNYLPDSANIMPYGIAIKKNTIEIGNKNDLNNFASFKFDEEATNSSNENFENEYICICVTPIITTKEEVENIIELIIIEHKKDINQTLVDIFNKLNEKFSKITKEISTKQYIGLFAELAFIYFCQQQQINIIDNYQIENDLFDFHFNSFDFEIKYLSKSSSTITVSDRQLNWIHKNAGNRIIAINIEQDSIKGINLNQLFYSIDFQPNLYFKKYLNIKTKINNLRNSSIELFNELKYDISTLHPIVIDNNVLPTIQFKNDSINQQNIISSAKFKIFVSYWQDNGQKIHEIINLLKNEKQCLPHQ